jgi:hypothetical protein
VIPSAAPSSAVHDSPRPPWPHLSREGIEPIIERRAETEVNISGHVDAVVRAEAPISGAAHGRRTDAASAGRELDRQCP